MITAKATLGSGIFATARLVSIQTILCADATVENSDASYSVTVASGGTLVVPNTPISANGYLVIHQPSTIAKDVVVRYATQGLVPTTIVAQEVVVPDQIAKSVFITFGFEIGNDYVERTMTSTDLGTYTTLISNGGLTSIVYKVDNVVVTFPFSIADTNVFKIEFDAAVAVEEIQIQGTYT